MMRPSLSLSLQGTWGTGRRDRNAYDALPATNGLRQCKGSLYEGGIRVPGLLEWPAVVRRNAVTWHPAYVADFLPTVLELLGVAHPHPDWYARAPTRADGGVGAGSRGVGDEAEPPPSP